MSEQPKDDRHWEQYRKPKGSKMKNIKLIGIMFFISRLTILSLHI